MVRNISKNEEKKHSFFKLLAGFNTDCVRIPPKFLKHMSKDLSERATLKLKNSSDSSWTVKVKKIREGAVYFKNGWEEFIRDNSLGTDNEMLTIFYEGNMHFSIRIFGENGIERTEELSSSESSELKEIKEEEEDSEDNTFEDLEADFTKIGSLHNNSTFAKNTTKRPRGRPRKYPVSSSKPRPSKSCKVESGEELSSSESEDNTFEDLEADFTKIGSLHNNSTFAKNTTKRPRGRPRKYPVSSSKPRPSKSCKVESGEELSSSESIELKEIKEEEEDSEDNTTEDLEADFTKIGSLHNNSTFAKNTTKRPRGRPRKYPVSSLKPRPSKSCKVESGEELSSFESIELKEIKEEEEDSEDNTSEDLEADFTKIGSLHNNSTFAKNTTKRPRGRPRKYPVSSSKPRPSKSCKVESGEELSSSESIELKEIKEKEEDSEDNTSEDLEADFTKIGSLHNNSTVAKNTTKRPRGRPRKYPVSSSKPRPSKSCKVESGEELSSSESIELNEIKEEEEDSEDSTSEDLEGVEPEAFKSNFPYFEGIINKTKCQFIPTAFSREHFPEGKGFKAILKNAEGEKWTVKGIPHFPQSHNFSEGWSEFVSANQIRIGDTCIFELLSRYQMTVHILRKR